MPIDYGNTMTDDEQVHVDGTYAATETFEGMNGDGGNVETQPDAESLDLPTTHGMFAEMADAWEQLSKTVSQDFKAARGSVALHTHSSDIARWLRMCEDRAERAITNLRSVKGETHPAREGGYAKRSLKRVAEEYFEKLSPKALQMQCSLFGVVYTPEPDTRSQVIAQLVEKQLELTADDVGEPVPF